ncbi:MAG: hypothetical protein JWP01_439 [Myxococcales bacterium]|nr:hypothetical protein [Myxococcales bacterium]
MLPLFVVERDGWTTLYPQLLEELPDTEVVVATKKLSAITHAPVFAFDVYDSDGFRYVLADDGNVQDEYLSNPAA